MNSPQDLAGSQRDRPRKQQRISQACDLCHRRSIRCRPSQEDTERCQNCYDFDVSCTFERPSKRKKHPQAPAVPQQPQPSPQTGSSTNSRPSTQLSQPAVSFPGSNLQRPSGRPHASTANSSSELTSPNRDHAAAGGGVGGAAAGPSDAVGLLLGHKTDQEQVSVAWKSFALACEPMIFELLEVYMQVVYPLWPLFHEETLRTRLKNKEHLSDRGFFASVMGACAVAAARVQDGAMPQSRTERLIQPQVSSEVFFSAARDALSKEMTSNEGFEYMRACTLLAITSIQWGHIGSMQQYMGLFFTLAAMQRFYDEKFWSRDLSDVQIELRRRVYWCTYTLDVYGATIWDCFLRSQEVHANVRYPGEILDTNSFLQNPESNWLVGWNFATDLYRILEHSLSKARAKRFRHEDRRKVDHLVFQDDFSDSNVMQTILGMYYELPAVFKETPPMTGDMRRDIYAYQAANIQATLQLLRIIIFSTAGGTGVDQKCDVVTEVLSVFHTIPREYLHAISTPLVYHLGHIGQVLASVIDPELTEQHYQRVRACLLSMADLLMSLEEGLSRAAGASQALRDSVDKLDKAMRGKRRLPHPVPNSGMSPAAISTMQMSQAIYDIGQNNMAYSTPSDFQLPPELFGDWSWPPDLGSQAPDMSSYQ